MSIQYQRRLARLLNAAVAQHSWLSGEINDLWFDEMLQAACDDLEARCEELAAHPAPLEQLVMPRLWEIVREQAEVIEGGSL